MKTLVLHRLIRNGFKVILTFTMISCGYIWAQTNPDKLHPADQGADSGVRNLYFNLAKLAPEYIMIGQQDALSYGINWKKGNFRSDMNDVTGSHPAVFGWDLGGIELGSKYNLDSVPFDEMRKNILWVYEQGGINTISWHVFNPVTGKSSWVEDKNTPNLIVSQILPGGEKHEAFLKQLDYAAGFFQSLVVADGSLAPIVFRPWHENSGSWFWWGSNHCSIEEYKQLYSFTVDYLRNKHNLHNLLYVYSPDVGFADAEAYLERYPGDDLIDIIGLDDYHSLNTGHPEELVKNLEIIASLAIERNKIATFSETGCNRIERKNYFTKELLPCLKHSALTRSVSWVLFWRNADEKQHFVPDPAHLEAPDFIEFTTDKLILQLNEIPDMYQKNERQVLPEKAH